eukprot:m.259275 g.259275  ORF g.259275 m.259275 type:complete len:483 (+) comp22728_c0_seq1:63-1511(+)
MLGGLPLVLVFSACALAQQPQAHCEAHVESDDEGRLVLTDCFTPPTTLAALASMVDRLQQLEGTVQQQSSTIARLEDELAALDTMDIAWTVQYGTSSNDEGVGIAVSSDGGSLFVVGTTQRALEGNAASGSDDVFVSKLSSNTGTRIWTSQFGSTGTDTAHAITVDSSGNILVTGDTGGDLAGSNVGINDVFVGKLAANNGSQLWVVQFGSSSPDLGLAIATATADDSVVVAGYTNGALPGNTNVGGNDVFVSKLASDGSLVWTMQFGSTSRDRCSGVATSSSDGSVFLVGSTLVGTQPNTNGNQVFVSRVTPSGSLVWTQQYGTAAEDTGQALAIDQHTGSLFVTGWTQGSFPGFTNAGSDDVFVSKLAPNGTQVWTVQFGSPETEHSSAIATAPDGSIFVTGTTAGALGSNTGGGQDDIFVAKLSSRGTLLWIKQFGTSAPDAASAIAYSDGSVFVAGYTFGALTGANTGGRDIFVSKLA